MVATLRLTDGTDYIELVQTITGMVLNNWRPVRAGISGTWRQSPFSDGRRMAHYKHENAIETFNFYTEGFAQDDLIRVMQKADRLLHKAMDYWTTDWQNEPVWVEAKATRETNARYAIVHTYQIPLDGNPYSVDFNFCGQRLDMDDLTLVIERGPWLSTEPGTGDCVEIFAEDVYDEVTVTRYYEAQANEDDVTAFVQVPVAGGIDDSNSLQLDGVEATGSYYHMGLRFPKINLSPGVTITAAFIRFQARLADAGGQTADIYGHRVSDSWDFSNEIATGGAAGVAMFNNRARTVATAAWAPPAWVLGNNYDTSDISTIIQEIIDLPGWSTGNSMTFFVQGNIAGQPGKTAEAFNSGVYNPRLYITVEGYTYGKGHSEECIEGYAPVVFEPAANADDVDIKDDLGGPAVQDNVTVGMRGNYASSDYRACGIRFVNVTVPKGAIIGSAYVKFQAAAGDVGSQDVNIYGHLDPDSDDFSAEIATGGAAGVAMFRNRVRTTAYQYWFPGAWILGNQYDTEQINAIVQEIIDQPNWDTGNPVTLFFQPAAPFGAAKYAEAFNSGVFNPELHITYYMPVDCGVCEDPRSVYFSNKHVDANLSHIYTWSAAAGWSGNLVGAIPPYDITPSAPIANGDFTIFGIETATGAGPYTNPVFDSLVFDIVSAVTYGGAATFVWQYSTGGPGWAALAVRDDTGDVIAGNLPFTNLGVNSVVWLPRLYPWLEQADGPGPTTCLWIRVLATIPAPPGDSITPAQQGNRDVYAIQWPYFQVDNEDIGGDIPALCRFIAENMSDRYVANPYLPSGRIICGLRSLSRGENFTAYLNISDEQNPAWVTVTDTGPGAMVTVIHAPSGKAIQWTPGALTALTSICTIAIDQAQTVEYFGEFRMFLRIRPVDTVVHTFQIGLSLSWATAEILGDVVTANNTAESQIVDMGTIRIPGAVTFNDSEPLAHITFQVYASAAAASDIYFYDLILIPTDEWSGDFESMTEGDIYNTIHTELHIDSLVYPKRHIRSVLFHDLYDYWVPGWRPISNGECILHPNADQKVWFLCTEWDATAEQDTIAENPLAHAPQVDAAQRYMSMRGDR